MARFRRFLPFTVAITSLIANDLTVGSPDLGNPAVGQIQTLTANSISVSSPVLDHPVVGQIHNLIADDLDVGSPVLGNPVVGTPGVPSASFQKLSRIIMGLRLWR